MPRDTSGVSGCPRACRPEALLPGQGAYFTCSDLLRCLFGKWEFKSPCQPNSRDWAEQAKSSGPSCSASTEHGARVAARRDLEVSLVPRCLAQNARACVRLFVQLHAQAPTSKRELRNQKFPQVRTMGGSSRVQIAER